MEAAAANAAGGLPVTADADWKTAVERGWLTAEEESAVLEQLGQWFTANPDATPEEGVKALGLPDMTGVNPRQQDRDSAQRRKAAVAGIILAHALRVKDHADQKRAACCRAGRQPAVTAPDSAAADARVWMQIREAVARLIAAGELKPDDPAPSVTTLCAEHHCARRTAGKAMASLESDGVLRRVPGLGYRVLRVAVNTEQLEALRWAWDGIYKIGASPDGRLEAWRTDGTGTVYADTPEALRALIREDWPKYVAGVAL